VVEISLNEGFKNETVKQKQNNFIRESGPATPNISLDNQLSISISKSKSKSISKSKDNKSTEDNTKDNKYLTVGQTVTSNLIEKPLFQTNQIYNTITDHDNILEFTNLNETKTDNKYPINQNVQNTHSDYGYGEEKKHVINEE